MTRSRIIRLCIVSIALAFVIAPPLAAYEGNFEQDARDLARSLKVAEVRSVAVVDFFDLRGRVTELGRFLADDLSTALVAANPSVKVIDRLRLAAILEEHKLSATGLLEEETARKVGRIAGVDVLITGRLTSFDETVRVSLQGLRVPSAEVVVSAVVEVPRTPRVAELETRSLTIDCGPEAERREISLDGLPIQQYQVHDLELTLHGCARVDNQIQCGIGVRSLEKEQNLYLEGKTRLAFEGGGQVWASRKSLGSEWATGMLSTVGSHLLPDIPVALGLVFEGVPEGASTIRFLELDFHGFKVRFQEIPIGNS